MKTEAQGAGRVRMEAGTAGLQAASGPPSPQSCFPRPHSLPSCGDRERGSEPIRKERPELLEDGERRLEDTLQGPLEPPVHGWKLAGSLFTIVVQSLGHVRLFAT